MSSICLYFQVHQPLRLARYNFDQIGNTDPYFDIQLNKDLIDKVSDNCYLPMNSLIRDLIKRTEGKFKVSFSISGTTIEQFEMYRPDVLKSFKALADTGNVEFLGETYYHSLSAIHSQKEFERQVKKHSDKIKKYFGAKPKIFRNTELIYNNEVAKLVAGMKFRGMLCETSDKYLDKGQDSGVVFSAPEIEKFGLLLRNHSLSDDIAFRFKDPTWSEYPLKADKYLSWLEKMPKTTKVVNLFMDYETFGEHTPKSTGIFEFFEEFVEKALASGKFDFRTPGEIIESAKSKAVYDVPGLISWADWDRDLSAWTENNMQQEAINRVYSLEDKVSKSKKKEALDVWGALQTSDHYYYMSTKYWEDPVHKGFNPFDSPYDAHIYYMNVLSDFEETL